MDVIGDRRPGHTSVDIMSVIGEREADNSSNIAFGHVLYKALISWRPHLVCEFYDTLMGKGFTNGRMRYRFVIRKALRGVLELYLYTTW
jgi:hypothetical protein